MGGGAPRSSYLGGEAYSSPGRSQLTDSLASPRLGKHTAPVPPSLYLKTRPITVLLDLRALGVHEEGPISFSRNPFLFFPKPVHVFVSSPSVGHFC